MRNDSGINHAADDHIERMGTDRAYVTRETKKGPVHEERGLLNDPSGQQLYSAANAACAAAKRAIGTR